MPRSSVTGIVLDRSGMPQAGALVSLLNSRERVVAQTYTDTRGHYHLPRLGAGIYQIEASGELFLPTLRTDLRLLHSSQLVVNLTLTTVNQALQWLPTQAPSQDGAPDDWSWTLRLATNRPLLRMLDPETAQRLGTEMVVLDNREGGSPRQPQKQLIVRSGLTRFGQGGLQQQAEFETQNGTGRALQFSEQTATGAGSAQRIATSAGYMQQLSADRTMTTVVNLSNRPDITSAGTSGLSTLRIRSASTVQFGDLGQFEGGTELVAAHMGDLSTAVASHPFASLRIHAGAMVVEYSVATAPTMTSAANLQDEAAQDAPALAEQDGRLVLEQGLHQQLAARRDFGHGALGALSGELAVFHDTMDHPILQGAVSGGQAAVDSQNVLYDPGTGMIAVSGKGYSGGGVMALLRDQLSPDTWLTLRYALGQAATLPSGATQTALQQVSGAAATRRAPMASVEAESRLPLAGTAIRASYRWQPLDTLTSVTPFVWEVPDAYLSIVLRQPLHLHGGDGSRLEAIVDVRNLLAQGYRPFLSEDGSTVFFAQSQRCIAAGLRLSF